MVRNTPSSSATGTMISNQFIGIANPGGAEPVPSEFILSSFLNIVYTNKTAKYTEAPPIYFAQNSMYLDGFNGNTSLSFEAGKTYRLRVVSTAAFARFYFWIDGRIIEVDGVRAHMSLLYSPP